MSVSVQCACGRNLKAKDEAAGKTGKCPACGNPVSFPRLDDGFDDFLSELPISNDGGSETAEPDDLPAEPAATKTCSLCGEEILAVAKKCKHCGEFLDQSLRQSRDKPKWNPGIAALLSLLIPGVGQMYKGQVGLGIFQLIGTAACYVVFLPLGAVPHLISFLHAALANPDRTAVASVTQTEARKSLNALIFTIFLILGFAGIAYLISDLLGGKR